VKKATVLRHVCFEDLGTFEPLLAAKGYSIESREAAIFDFALMDPVEPDLMVILGGPIGAYEEDLYPFLAAELAAVGERLAASRPTLGICLGAQLMARALGARVYPGPAKEIGWAPIELSEEGSHSPLVHLSSKDTYVLHWHGDTFDLPEGATHLASTAICHNQAFSWGGCALALQFHPEVSRRNLERWLVGHALEIAKTDGVTVESLRQGGRIWSDKLARQTGLFFGDWLDSLAAAP
jgi:GMP synthase (glutamine-hydrolysing)